MHTIDCECTYSAMQLQRNLSKKLDKMNVTHVEKTNVQPHQNGVKRKFCIALGENGGTDVSTLLQKQRKLNGIVYIIIDKENDKENETAQRVKSDSNEITLLEEEKMETSVGRSNGVYLGKGMLRTEHLSHVFGCTRCLNGEPGHINHIMQMDET